MERKTNLLRRMLDFGELEEEGMPGQSIVELLGNNRVLIENHRRVIEYDLARVCIRVSFGTITILGSNLRLRAMTAGKLIIAGNIDRIDICRGSGV